MTQSNQGSTGYGQQVPEDGNTDTNSAIFIIRQLLAELDTVKLVKVNAVHPGQGSPPVQGTVDVQLLTNLLDGAGNPTQQGVVYGMPYFRLNYGKWQVCADPAVGDIGIAVCADRDISASKNTFAAGQVPGNANPSSYRKLNISDGVYLGGILNPVPAGWIWLKDDGTLEISDALQNVLQSSSGGWTLTPTSGGVLKVNGAIEATGNITGYFGTANSVDLAHVHSNVEPGSGESGPPVGGT